MRARDNPFSISRLAPISYRFPDQTTSVATILAELARHRFRGAITGREGHGKSTLLSEIGRRLEKQLTVHRFILHRGQSSLPDDLGQWLRDSSPRDALLLDGAEQLSWPAWFRLKRSTRRLGAFIITSHREGLLPTVFRCRTSAELLANLLDEVCPDRPRSFPSVLELFERHRGDLRQALFEAYDFHARDPHDEKTISQTPDSALSR